MDANMESTWALTEQVRDSGTEMENRVEEVHTQLREMDTTAAKEKASTQDALDELRDANAARCVIGLTIHAR